VFHVMPVITWLMENVSKHQFKHLLTQAVVLGTGKTKNVSNALKIGSSTPTESVCLFQTNAIPLIYQATVSHVTKDTVCQMENVCWLLLRVFQTLAVVYGTGTIKNVFNALKTGFSILMESVCQFLTNAILLILKENVLAVILATI